MKIIKSIFIAATLLTSSVVSADVLTGVKELTILIEELDSDASKCNISKDMIDSSIRLPLANSKIRVVKNSDYPDSYLYVIVMAIDAGTMCRLYVELSYNKYIATERKYGQFWRKNVLLSINKSSIIKAVSDDLEAFSKQFIGAWLKANPTN